MKTRKRKYTRGGASNEKLTSEELKHKQLEMAKNISEVVSLSRKQYTAELKTLFDTRAIRLIELISLHKQIMNQDDQTKSKMTFKTQKDKIGNNKQVVYGYDLAYLLLTKDEHPSIDAELSSLLDLINKNTLYDVKKSKKFFGRHNPTLYPINKPHLGTTIGGAIDSDIDRYTVPNVLSCITNEAQDINAQRNEIIENITGTTNVPEENKRSLQVHFRNLLKGCEFKDPFTTYGEYKDSLKYLEGLNLGVKHKAGFVKLFKKHWGEGDYARECKFPFENIYEHIKHSDASYEYARNFTIEFYKNTSKSNNGKEVNLDTLTEDHLVELMTNSLFTDDENKKKLICLSHENIKEFLLKTPFKRFGYF